MSNSKLMSIIQLVLSIGAIIFNIGIIAVLYSRSSIDANDNIIVDKPLAYTYSIIGYIYSGFIGLIGISQIIFWFKKKPNKLFITSGIISLLLAIPSPFARTAAIIALIVINLIAIKKDR